MTVLLSALAFLLLLTALILIHELGHFLVARRAGVIVEEFGFGLPPRVRSLFSWQGTLFSLNWIPFGGFVRLRGENAVTDAERRAAGSFGAAPIPARIAILTAGVFMNFLVAIVLLTMGFSVGRWVPTYQTLDEMEQAAARGEIDLELAVLVTEVVSGEGAAQVGVPPRSILVAVGGVPVRRPEEVAPLQEGKRQIAYTLLTGEDFAEEQVFTVPLSEGKAGVVLTPFPRRIAAPARSALPAFLLALRESRVMTVQTVIGIGQLFSSLARTGAVPEGITGIVGIAQLTYASVQEGFMTYLRLVALLSLSLAILNLLPFPALDGGRLLFVLAELVRRRPVNRRFELLVNAIGFGVLLFLILLITFHDIARLF
jgi:regulator of sigma E protease